MSKQQVDKLAWFPLYTSDYLGDTTGLSCCEHGAYLLMLIEYWQHGPLDDNLDRLARITQNPPPETISYILEKYWMLTDFGWEQSKMRKIKEIQVESHQKRVKSGRLGGKAKASNAIAMIEQCYSNAPSNGGSNALATQNPESRIQNPDLRAQSSESRLCEEARDAQASGSRSAPRVTFKPPSVPDVLEYMETRGAATIDEAEKFFDFYESKGWFVGKTKMKSWKAAVRNWLKRSAESKCGTQFKTAGQRRDEYMEEQVQKFLSDDNQGNILEGACEPF